ncbi:MAG: exosortase/archaeosortase family protein [Verrucomicrobia bacterium]|nr:exosortase/archaeosortase family protein [Verrucomicrobiota bacterium]
MQRHPLPFRPDDDQRALRPSDPPRRWRKILLFAASLPLAILGNFSRVLMLTFGTLLFGNDIAIGSHEDPSGYHLAAGFAVFVVALGGMVLLGRLLEGRKQPVSGDSGKMTAA